MARAWHSSPPNKHTQMQQIQTLDEFSKLPEGTKVTVHFLARNTSDVLTVHAGRLVSETGFTATLLEFDGAGEFTFNMSGHTQLVGLSVEKLSKIRFQFCEEQTYEGYDSHSTWNGWDNVRVTPKVFDQISKDTYGFTYSDSKETKVKMERAEAVEWFELRNQTDSNGLISLGWCYCTVIVKGSHCETCQDDVDISKLFDPENFLEGTFRKLCDEFNLEHGGIDPLQAFRLDELGLEIKDILTSFVKQNLPEVEQTCDDVDVRFHFTSEACPDCDGTKSVDHFPEEWGGRVTEQKPCETCQDDVVRHLIIRLVEQVE